MEWPSSDDRLESSLGEWVRVESMPSGGGKREEGLFSLCNFQPLVLVLFCGVTKYVCSSNFTFLLSFLLSPTFWLNIPGSFKHVSPMTSFLDPSSFWWPLKTCCTWMRPLLNTSPGLNSLPQMLYFQVRGLWHSNSTSLVLNLCF